MVGRRGDGGPVKFGLIARLVANDVGVVRSGDANILSFGTSTFEMSPNFFSSSSSSSASPVGSAPSEGSVELSSTFSSGWEGREELATGDDHLLESWTEISLVHIERKVTRPPT